MSFDRGDGELAEELRQPVMVLRVIVVALAGGIVIFAAVAIGIRAASEAQPAQEWNLLTWMAFGAAPIALVASLLLPSRIADGARRQIAASKLDASRGTGGPQATLPESDDVGALYGVYQTKTIVGAALLEGAAFLSIIAFLLEGAWITLGIGVGLAAVILTRFPSASRVAEWVERQLRRIDEEQPPRR